MDMAGVIIKLPMLSRNPTKPEGSEDPNNTLLGPKHYTINGIWTLKPYYLGPWTLRKIKVPMNLLYPNVELHRVLRCLGGGGGGGQGLVSLISPKPSGFEFRVKGVSYLAHPSRTRV